MKLFFLLVAVSAVVLVSAKDKKECDSQSDCEENECCVVKSLFRKPECHKRGTSHNDKCVVEKFKVLDKYLNICPCIKGMVCEPEGTELGGLIKINERCVPKTETTAKAKTTTQPKY